MGSVVLEDVAKQAAQQIDAMADKAEVVAGLVGTTSRRGGVAVLMTSHELLHIDKDVARSPLESVTKCTFERGTLTIVSGEGVIALLPWSSVRQVDEFRKKLHELTGKDALAVVQAQVELLLPPSRMTTLTFLPGFHIRAVLGVASELTSASGWTAATKGNTALAAAMVGLNRTARDMGANAVLGISATTFGAHGGITSGLGGDAVGVLLLGTAVIVEEDSPPTDAPGAPAIA